MLSPRPLLATAADEGLFAGTEAWHELALAVERRNNVLVLGESGSGKTSALHMLEHRLRGQGDPAVYASLQGLSDVGQAAVQLWGAAHDQAVVGELPDDLLRAVLDGEDPFAVTALVRAMSEWPPATTLLVDDVGASVGNALFGRLRDELWQLPLAWVVAADLDQAAGLLRPPANAFFDTRVELTDLSSAERQKLLNLRARAAKRPLRAADVDLLASEGPGNPRQLIAAARNLAERPGSPYSSQKLIAAGHKRLERAEAVAGRPAAMLVTEMEGRGPVSASDAELLERLGWTRPRAAELLTALEKGGVVRSFTEASEGRTGRPRRLFELLPAEEFV